MLPGHLSPPSPQETLPQSRPQRAAVRGQPASEELAVL